MAHAKQMSGTDRKAGQVEEQKIYEPSILSSPTAKMDFLYGELAARGIVSNGMSWRLLLMEWRYDISVLMQGFGSWMKQLDVGFDKARR